MTGWILGSATVILLILMFWRRISPEFKRKSEEPKFHILANLGLGLHARSHSADDVQDVHPERNHDEKHKP
jgi:hypothetical protein